MVIRRRSLSTTPTDQMRDYIIRILRSDELRNLVRPQPSGQVPEACDLDDMVRWIERDSSLDRTRDKCLARHLLANTIQNQLDDFKEELDGLVADGSISASEAKQRLAQKKKTLTKQHGHLSVDAFRKWMRDNLPRPSRG